MWIASWKDGALRSVVVAALTFVGSGSGGGGSEAVAAPPRVSFDAAALVEVVDVTSPEFAAVSPHERLIEARFPVSALLAVNAHESLSELLYRIDSPEGSLRVVNFMPRTTLTSEYATNLAIEEKSEQDTNVGLNAAGGYGPVSSATGHFAATEKFASLQRFELLPPLETVAASGTVGRGNGVYFKLRPTQRTSVEGAQEVIVVYRVPSTWRTDYVTIRCRAYGESVTGPFGTKEATVWGQASFVVAMYLQGDSGAQMAARDFVAAESNLRRMAATKRTEVEKRAVPTPVHELAVHFGGKSPRIPDTWLEQLLVGPEREAVQFLGYLPGAVRESAIDYTAARRKLRAVNAGPERLPEIAALK